MYALYLWAYVSHGAYVMEAHLKESVFFFHYASPGNPKVMRLEKRHSNTADHLVYSQD